MTRRARPLTILLAALVVAACGSPPAPSPSTPRSPDGSPAVASRPVIIDVDLDQSDVLAVAILVRDPALDVQALTVTGTGIVRCPAGLRLGRGLLDALGRADLPVACGREEAGGGARPFPDAWRDAADDGWGMSIADAETPIDPPTATDLIATVVAATELPVTIFAAGPLTNVADALSADPSMAERLERIHLMGGVVDALGNVVVDDLGPGDGLEWNFVADPEAVAAVFASQVPLRIVPLDATDDVPFPADLLARLEEDHAAAGADLAYEQLIRSPNRVTDAGSQLWDELAALTVSEPDLVTWETIPLRVVPDGRLAGRIEREPAGRIAEVATAAGRERVEAALLVALRRGAPREEPFAIAGEERITWDGSSCAWDGAVPAAAGVHRLTFANHSDADAGATAVGIAAPHRWSDLLDFLATVDPTVEAQPPAWVALAGSFGAAAGRSGTGIVDLMAGMSGIVCVGGTWPDVTFAASAPVDLPPD